MGALVEINTDGLAKLVQTIGNWLGLEAKAIERNAKAEASALVCKAKAEKDAAIIRLQGEDNVANYMLAREKRKMNNVYSVVCKAQNCFKNDEAVSEEQVNIDWLNRFFSIVEDVSDEDMQKLWAQVLAGEVKRPKSYSLRTLELLKNLSKDEAAAIKEASKYFIDKIFLCTEVFGAGIDVFSKMDELGIICGKQLVYTYFIDVDATGNINIGNTYYLRIYSNKKLKIPVKCYYLTKVGKEIFSLAKDDNLDFALELVKHFDRKEIFKMELFKILEVEDQNCIVSTDNILHHYKYLNEEKEVIPIQPFMM